MKETINFEMFIMTDKGHSIFQYHAENQALAKIHAGDLLRDFKDGTFKLNGVLNTEDLIRVGFRKINTDTWKGI